jgi:type VI secretion system protein ImpH
MASADGDDPGAVDILPELGEQIRQYDFFAALRRLECQFADKPRLGQSLRPADDAVRLGQEPSTLFAPSTLFSCQPQEDGRWHLKVLFLGLFGPNGPLPLHLTEYARDRVRHARDTSLVEFLDLFHHRLLSLFYRAWANKEPTVQYDRPAEDRFHTYIGSLLGIGSPELQHRDVMPDDNKLYFAAHLGSQTRHVSGLTALLRSFFQVPLQVEEFVGEWLKIPAESQSRLGRPLGGQLGMDAVLGRYSWQRQYKFRIHLGPMGLQEYEELLPGGEKLRLLGTVIRNYLGDELNWDVKLVLRKEDVPPARLGKYGRLGLTTWAVSQTLGRDADDLAVGRERAS